MEHYLPIVSFRVEHRTETRRRPRNTEDFQLGSMKAVRIQSVTRPRPRLSTQEILGTLLNTEKAKAEEGPSDDQCIVLSSSLSLTEPSNNPVARGGQKDDECVPLSTPNSGSSCEIPLHPPCYCGSNSSVDESLLCVLCCQWWIELLNASLCDEDKSEVLSNLPNEVGAQLEFKERIASCEAGMKVTVPQSLVTYYSTRFRRNVAMSPRDSMALNSARPSSALPLSARDNFQAYELDLKCPWSRKVMNVPGRSRFCEHLPCFDIFNMFHIAAARLNEALLINKHHLQQVDADEIAAEDTTGAGDPVFTCPICRVKFGLEDVVVDWFVLKIAQHCKKADTAVVNGDGSWTYISTDQKKRQKNQTAAVVDVIEIE